MDVFWNILFWIAVGGLLIIVGRRVSAKRPASSPAPAAPNPNPPVSWDDLAMALDPVVEAANHPGSLLEKDEFKAAVAFLTQPSMSLDEVIKHALDDNLTSSSTGMEALLQRPDGTEALPRVVPALEHMGPWQVYFALRLLAARSETAVIAKVVLRAQESWLHMPVWRRVVSDFIDARVARGEVPDLREELEKAAPKNLPVLEAFLTVLTTPHADRLRESYREWRGRWVDSTFLATVGKEWRAPLAGPPVIVHERLREAIALARVWIERTPSTSFLVAGEPRVGKTALVRALAAELMASGWTVFEASAVDVIAGQSHVGQIEQRIRELLENIRIERRVVWYIPNFHELFYAGRHMQSPVGVLDIIMPAVESGSISILGEVEVGALERVIQQRPRVQTAFKRLHVEAMSDADALSLADEVVARELQPRRILVAPEVLREAMELSRHQLAGRKQPGALLDLLRATAARIQPEDGRDVPLSRDDLLSTVTQLTGLPRYILDERAGLDPQALRTLFQRRVLGQPEAIDCLVDRIAMLKAGLTDPKRPIGVFLFAGPTGTGKTEAAKTLAESLFGSAERMIRLDMSEFQEPASISRLLGSTGELSEADPLVHRIRKQPFSVVLLDEFEKANPRIWDMFLQVFDDARLTDAIGNVADFRHSIIILTTNLGAPEQRGTSFGFTDGTPAHSAQRTLRAIGQAFRPEFINRLDRVVVFQPLSKAVMRDILRKELRDIMQRRGFRHHEWAVEWEESAIDFLLEKGFTVDMGARPLRRAIDQHVLAPIAMTIVEHRFPEGDQFLFVRSDGKSIQVEFVDPDATPAPAAVPEPASATPHLASLILASSGTIIEIELLEREVALLEAELDATAWVETKRVLYARLNEDGFWDRADRYETLGRIELLDRIEAGTRAVRSLLRRLGGRSARSNAAPRSLVQSLAQQIVLLRAAHADLRTTGTSDAYLSVEAVALEGRRGEPSGGWTQRIASMYREWARMRHLRITVLGQDNPCILAVSGLGAHHILEREAGLHVLEVPDPASGFARTSARVRVVAQPLAPHSGAELQHALTCLNTITVTPIIVRRYRELPSPLVRDAAGWRSGRIEQILGGDFDVIASEVAESK